MTNLIYILDMLVLKGKHYHRDYEKTYKELQKKIIRATVMYKIKKT